MMIWKLLKIWDPQVTMGLNTKSWSNDHGWQKSVSSSKTVLDQRAMCDFQGIEPIDLVNMKHQSTYPLVI